MVKNQTVAIFEDDKPSTTFKVKSKEIMFITKWS